MVDELQIREALRIASADGKLSVIAAVLGCGTDRLEEIDDGAEMTDLERSWFGANLDMSGV